jgi:D-glycero-alpha-D-manno-heptose-7-phosphate kinase
MIISRTPFRVSFFGGGTDFPEFFREHGGSTLLTTINKFCYISIHRLSTFFHHRFRASYSRTETVMDPCEFAHPLIRECLLHLKPSEGLEIAHVSDLPGRTGLGTSSAFTVGLLNALHTFSGDRVTAEDLAREAILIERQRVGDIGGHQDQYAAAYGGLIRINFLPNGRVDVRRMAVCHDRIHQLEQHLLMFYMGTEQSAEAVLHEQRQRVKQNHSALMEMLKMVDEAEAIITGSSDIAGFGELLHRSWEFKKTLSNGISNTNINDAYTVARNAGAMGGKLLGAGGRGFLLLFARPDKHELVRQSLSALREVHFQFSQEGSRIIFQAPE